MTQFDLLKKSELRIEGISLQSANLNEIASTVADVLELSEDEVLVTDLRRGVMTVDVLKQTVDPHGIIAKQGPLLERLSKLPGVTVSEKSIVSSEGMLGWIVLDADTVEGPLKRAESMVREISHRLSRRAIVFSTGHEVASGQIEDTNKPTIARRLEVEGYSVALGPVLEDDELVIAATLRQALEEHGYGLVITTGGIGAEDKDRTVEAVLALDPDAATPYICRYRQGEGRHHKDGVRIAVGQAFEALVVTLPGPNDEVRSSLDVLVDGLKSGLSKHALAEQVAANLRRGLREKMKH